MKIIIQIFYIFATETELIYLNVNVCMNVIPHIFCR